MVDHLANFQKRLQTGARFLDAHPAWVPPNNLHLTLIFLGMVEESRVPDIQQSLDDVAEPLLPFDLALGDLELFPDPKEPKVISCGIHGPGLSGLRRFQEALRYRLTQAGFALESRLWRPHITLARIKSIKSGDRMGPLVKSHQKLAARAYRADSLTLYQSSLGSGTPEYKVLHQIRLSD